MFKIFKKKKKLKKVYNENYKTVDELTEEDYKLIDLDMMNTGITHYNDEYYYNNILYQNYDYCEQEA